MAHCLAKDRHGDTCRNYGLGESRFCNFHQYMNDYTEDMLSQLVICVGCKKAYYFEEEERKTCDACRERGQKIRVAKRESVVLCEKKGCKSKRSVENVYCGKHQICMFEDETAGLNKKVCANFIRGCRAQLEIEYAYSRCEECLEKDRVKDKERRGRAKEEKNTPIESAVQNIVAEIVEEEEVVITEERKEETENTTAQPIVTTQKCNSCYKILSIDKFIGVKTGSITKGCVVCREKNKIRDANRDKEHRREIARKTEQKPERKAIRAKWAEENHDKVAKRWMDYRQRKIERLGTEEYLKQQAAAAKNWRDKNSEKMAEVNERKKNSKEQNYKIYEKSAEYKNLEFAITYDDYVNIVNAECYYCGIIQDKGFNGIDRKDQTKGYVVDNCVSCCKLCNYMKGSLSDCIFIQRAEHILTFQCKIEGKLHPECFANYRGSSYDAYRSRALKKELEFLLTLDDYNTITQKDCFLCGKKTEDNHRNGIDRLDNTKGYILDNVNTCCGECNYMKKEFAIDDIMNKLMLIHQKHKCENRVVLQNTIQYNKHVVSNVNKKTKDEIREMSELQKKKNREALQEKYADEEYKKARAKELAERRKNK